MITEENFIDFTCPHCDGPVSFPAENAGLAQECPSCGETLIVAAESGSPGGKLPFPIPTPRLVLRRFIPGDWKDLMECLSDEEVFRYTGGRPLEEDEVLRWLDSDAHVKLTTVGQPLFLGVQLKEPGKLIGYVQLHLDPHRTQASLDILLHRGYQNKGTEPKRWMPLSGFALTT